MTERVLALTTCAILFGASVAPAQAQLARTFVSSVNGSDGNDCSQPTPCRSFQAAHDKTFDGGEVTVLSTGGYGALTITKSISIVSEVGEASVLVSGGATGISINAGTASYINLRGITIQGIGFGGSTGLRFNSGFALTITNSVIRNHTGDGIHVTATNSKLAVSRTLVSDNGGNGIHIQPNGANVRVDAVLFQVEAYTNSGSGIAADGALSGGGLVVVNVQNSVSANNLQSGFSARSGSQLGSAAPVNLFVIGSVATSNNTGFSQEGIAEILVGQSTVNSNFGGGAVVGSNVFSFGDNYSIGNGLFGDGFPMSATKR